MNRRNLCKALGSLPLIIPSLWNAQANAAPRCISEEKTAGAKNVILFIGDGMSLGQWQTGAIANKTPLQVERFRSIGLVRTNPLTEFNGDAPSHGTAIATGVNSHKGAVGVDADDRPVKSILRYAAERGIATGIVSANSLLEGCLVPFIAHVSNRMAFETLAAGYVENPVDVFIGGGSDFFTKRQDGRDLTAELRAMGYRLATSPDGIDPAAAGKVGVFTAEKMLPNVNKGRRDLFARSIRGALEILRRNKDGFLLVAGDTFPDKASHVGDIELIAQKTIDLDRTVGEALNFAERDGQTLVIVVGGSEASAMSIVGGNVTQGTVEGKWAIPGMGNHSGIMVPLFAEGPGASLFQGIQSNTDIFTKLMRTLRLA